MVLFWVVWSCSMPENMALGGMNFYGFHGSFRTISGTPCQTWSIGPFQDGKILWFSLAQLLQLSYFSEIQPQSVWDLEGVSHWSAWIFLVVSACLMYSSRSPWRSTFKLIWSCGELLVFFWRRAERCIFLFCLKLSHAVRHNVDGSCLRAETTKSKRDWPWILKKFRETATPSGSTVPPRIEGLRNLTVARNPRQSHLVKPF